MSTHNKVQPRRLWAWSFQYTPVAFPRCAAANTVDERIRRPAGFDCADLSHDPLPDSRFPNRSKMWRSGGQKGSQPRRGRCGDWRGLYSTRATPRAVGSGSSQKREPIEPGDDGRSGRLGPLRGDVGAGDRIHVGKVSKVSEKRRFLDMLAKAPWQ